MHVGIAYLRWRGKRSRHSRRMRTRNFAYLARGPWVHLKTGQLCRLWYFLWCYPKLIVEFMVEEPVIWDRMTLMWRHCNVWNSISPYTCHPCTISLSSRENVVAIELGNTWYGPGETIKGKTEMSKYTHLKIWYVITRPCPTYIAVLLTVIDMRTWMNDYISKKTANVIINLDLS